MGQSCLMELNIQKFASNGCTVSVSETTNTETNTSTFTITATVTTNSTTFNQTTNGAYVQGSYSGGASGSLSKQSFQIAKSSSVTKTWTISNVPHNSDGTLGQITFSVTWYVTSASSSHGTTTKSINPATISRYANITSFSVSQRDETSVTYNWSADAVCDYAWYSLDGANWYDLPNSNVVGGLSSGTSYNFYLRVRRADSQLTSTAGPVPQWTYYIPHVTGCTSATIGQNISVYIYNPLGRTYTLQLISINNNQIIGAYYGSSTTDVTGFGDTTTQNNMYASIPNSTQGQYRTKLVSDYGTHEWDSRGYGNYYVDTNASKPTFNLFEWEDVNQTTLSLTGNSQTIVNGQSNVKATISVNNKATPKNYASIVRYEYKCGNQQENISYSSSSDVSKTINNVTSNTFQIRAVDSRGIPSDYVSLVANDYIQYNNLIKGNASISRIGEVSSQTTITFNGKVSLVDFGLVQNSVTNVTYQYKTASDADYTTGDTTITPTVDANGNFTFTGLIKGDTPDGFDPQNVYSILVNVFDELSNPYITFALTLQSGKPHLAWHKNGLSVMGKYDETEGGLFQIDGHSIDKQKICVGSQVIFAGVAGTGPVSKTPLLGAYNYGLIDFDTGYGNDSEKYVPSGYHKEYRISYQGTCNGNGQIYVYLNNIKSNGIGTWSGASFRIIGITDYFKKSDIVLETTYGYGQPGCNLYYEFDSSSGMTFEIYYITVHEYIVKD